KKSCPQVFPLSLEVITTKVGRLSVSLPSPYDNQAPMLGRPGTCAPVMKNVTPGAWLTASVYMLRTRQISSASAPTFGSIALSSIPDWPSLLNGLIAGRVGHLP